MFKLTGCVLPADQDFFPSFFFDRLDLSALPVCLESGTEIGAILSNYVNADDLYVKCFIDSKKMDGSIAIQDIQHGTIPRDLIMRVHSHRNLRIAYIKLASSIEI